MSYVYLRAENAIQVGFFDPTGKWHAESDWATEHDAAARVTALNGTAAIQPILAQVQEAEAVIRRLLLTTSYEAFHALRRPAEKSAASLREILEAQDRAVCERLEAMRRRAS